MSNLSRSHKIVVWGATGFTGRLVCEHIASNYNSSIKWAMAGRSREKLQQVRDLIAERCQVDLLDVPLVVADLSDTASLDEMASDTEVIISTAGPFTRLGTPIVDAAVRNECHYVDITGEAPWVKKMIKEYDSEAESKGIRIIPCCGYDSIPSDLGAMMVVNELKSRGKKVKSVLSIVGDSKGGVSGGTLASAMEIAADSSLEAKSLSPYALIPEGQTPGSDKDIWGPRYNEPLKKWLAPFVMQVVNSRVVQRSNYLLDWGRQEFSYSEMIAAPGRISAIIIATLTAAFGLAVSQVWLHGILKRVLPSPGEGPSRETMLSGYYKHKIIGESTDGDRVVAIFEDSSRDPGYWGTSRLLLEAGLCLALQQDELEKLDCPVKKGGVLTPASALGPVLLERLRSNAGIDCRIVSE